MKFILAAALLFTLAYALDEQRRVNVLTYQLD